MIACQSMLRRPFLGDRVVVEGSAHISYSGPMVVAAAAVIIRSGSIRSSLRSAFSASTTVGPLNLEEGVVVHMAPEGLDLHDGSGE